MINQAGVNKIICNFDIEHSNDRMYINVNDFKKELFDEDRHVIQKASNIAYILFTSGSTGKPKGVIVEREALENFVTGIGKKVDILRYSNFLCSTEYTFDIFFMELLVSISWGLDVILTEDRIGSNPRKIISLLNKNSVDCIQLTPSAFNLLYALDNQLTFLKNIKCIMLGGEMFPDKILNILRPLGLRILNMYGPTEATVWVTVADLTNKEEITIGTPIDNVDVLICNEEYQELPIGEEGEICIIGKSLARGYLTEEQYGFSVIETNKGVIKVYKTGDIGKLRAEDNEIICLGRKDRQVKVNGHRIELDEIDNVLQNAPDIISCKSFIDNDGKIMTFYKSKNKVKTESLLEYAQNILPRYMLPNKFQLVDDIPLLSSGKIDNASLIKHNNEDVETQSEKIDPVTKTIFDMISSLKNIKLYDPDTKFDILNLDSFEYVQIIIKLEDTFQILIDDENLSLNSFEKVSDLTKYVIDKTNNFKYIDIEK